MKRKLVLLTDGEVATIRAALRTMAGESFVPLGPIDRLSDKIDRSPSVTKGQWINYQNAAGEMLEAGADEAHQHLGRAGVAACHRFEQAMRQAWNG